MSKKSRDLIRRDVQIQAERQEFFSGPLPPPEKLAQYEQILPGAAERIMQMAERQSEHRRSLESRVVNSDIWNSRIGLIFGFVIGVIGVGGGIWLMGQGMTYEGGIISGGTIASLVGTFVYGSRQRRKERIENQALLQK